MGKVVQQSRDWNAQHPDEVKARHQEENHKGGKYYEHTLEYNSTGLQGGRHKIRNKHGNLWRVFKQIIAPESQIHHEWIPGTAEYTGVALVESNPHRYGIIDVIKILEGKITLFTEKEIGEQK